MSLIFCESFDALDSGSTLAAKTVMEDKWASACGIYQPYATPTAHNQHIRMRSGNYNVDMMPSTSLTTDDTLIVGFDAYRGGGYDAYAQTWAAFQTGGTQCIKIILCNDMFIVRDGSDNDIGFSDRWRSRYQEWNFIEIKAKCHDTTGTFEMRINGVPIVTLTGLDTKFGANSYFDEFSWGPGTLGGQQNWRYDNLYICDGAGSVNNDFLGRVIVDTIFPDGDDTTQFETTGNGSLGTHYEHVDTQIPDPSGSGLDRIEESTTTGNRDIFTMGATINHETVHAVVGVVHAEAATSNENYHMVFDSNGTEVESSDIPALTTGNSTDLFIRELDPDTSSAWTSSTVNAVKFGVEYQ